MIIETIADSMDAKSLNKRIEEHRIHYDARIATVRCMRGIANNELDWMSHVALILRSRQLVEYG